MFPGADLALFHFFAALIFAPETSCEWEKSKRAPLNSDF